MIIPGAFNYLQKNSFSFLNGFLASLLLACSIIIFSGCNQSSEEPIKATGSGDNSYVCTGAQNPSKVVELIPYIQYLQGVTCQTCHTSHHREWSGLALTDTDSTAHGGIYLDPDQNPETPGVEGQCGVCHGEDLAGGISTISCNECHHGTGGMAEGHAGIDCISCHDFSGGGGTPSSDCADCHGDSGSHAVHIGANSKGPTPYLDCIDCHADGNYPSFENGNNLASTTVCDNCHSPGGAYDGLNDPAIGAKNNWSDGIYDGDILKAGKERWCVGCHDDDPSNHLADGSGINAPKIAGDNSSYGFYVTGHSAELCTNCHDLSINHIDGLARTYVAPTDIFNPGDFYQNGYRLMSVNGESPMIAPLYFGSVQNSEPFRLCFSCHTNPDSFLEEGNLTSNFREDSTSANYHYYHLKIVHNSTVGVGCSQYCHNSHHSGILTLPWDSDLDGIGDSDMTCVSCHNVHGSNAAAMVRTGELIGHPTGLNLTYLDNLPEDPWNFKIPQTVDGSTGGAFDIPESLEPIGVIGDNGVCIMCHQQRVGYYRAP